MNWDAPTVKKYVIDTIVPNRYFVDIGAGDGITDSNTSQLVVAGWSGMFAEMDDRKCNALKVNYGHDSKRFYLCLEKITPLNIVMHLKKAGIPVNFAYMSVDIDGFDYEIVSAIFSGGFFPRVITVELNEMIPPPISFYVRYTEKYQYTRSWFFGCSLQAYCELMSRNGYQLVDLNYNNAYYVKNDFAESNRWAARDPRELWENNFAKWPEAFKRDCYNERRGLIFEISDMGISDLLRFVKETICAGRHTDEYYLFNFSSAAAWEKPISIEEWRDFLKFSFDNGTREPVYKYINEYVKDRIDVSFLEIGFGQCRDFLQCFQKLHDRGFIEYVGADITSQFVSYAEREYPKYVFRQGGFANADSFDIIFTANTLEHQHPDEYGKALRNMLDAARELCIIIWFQAPRQNGYMHWESNDGFGGVGAWVNRYDKNEIVRIINDRGFSLDIQALDENRQIYYCKRSD